MSAGGTPPPAQRNVRSWFWSYSPPGRIGSGSWATTGPATRIDGDDRHDQGADPPPTRDGADHGCTSSGLDDGRGGVEQADGGRVGRPPDALEQHGATRPVDAGARRRPVAARLVARRRGDVGRDTRPHVERCQVPIALEHERSAADGRGPGARDDRLAGTGRRGRRPTRRTGTRGRRRRRSRATRADAERPVRSRSSRPRRRSPGRRSACDTRARRTTRPRAARPSAHRRSVENVRPWRASGARPGRSRDRRPAAGRAAPDAEVRARHPVDPMLERRAEVRVEDGAADRPTPPSAIVDRAAAGRIDRAQAGPRAVVIADQHDAPTGPEANDSGRQGELPARVRRPRPSVSRWPASVPAASSTASSRNHATPADGGRAATAARTRRRIPRRVRRLEHGRPGDAGRPQQRDRGQGHERTRESKHLHEGLLRRDDPAGGGRGGQCRDDGHLSADLPGQRPVVPSRPSTGVLGPLHIRRGVVAKPVRIRHSPATVTAPLGAEVRSPIRRRRSSLREKGQAHRAIHRLTPPSIPKRGVRPFLVPPSHPEFPWTHAPGRRTAVAPHPFPALLLLLLAAVLAACVVAGRQRQPDRRRARLPAPVATPTPHPTPEPTASPTAAPAFPLTLTDDEGTEVTIPAEPTKIVPRSPTRRPRPVRARRRRPGRRQGRGLQRRIRPRSPTSPTSPSSARSTSRRSWPGHRPRDRRRQQLQPAGVDRQAPLARRPGRRRVRARRPDRARRHRADRAGGRQARRGRRDHGRRSRRRVRRGHGRDVRPGQAARLLRARRDERVLRAGARTTSAPR